MLVIGAELEADGFNPGDVEKGDSGGIGKLANGLKRGLSADWVLLNENIFFSGLPGAGWLGLSRMLLKTLEVAEPSLLPLAGCHLLL